MAKEESKLWAFEVSHPVEFLVLPPGFDYLGWTKQAPYRGLVKLSRKMHALEVKVTDYGDSGFFDAAMFPVGKALWWQLRTGYEFGGRGWAHLASSAYDMKFPAVEESARMVFRRDKWAPVVAAAAARRKAKQLADPRVVAFFAGLDKVNGRK